MRFLPLLLIATLWACDSNDAPDEPVIFQSTEVEARGDARVEITAEGLLVSGIGASGADGVFVAGDLRSFDMETLPISIPEGGAFGIRVEDTAGALVSGFRNVDRPGVDGHDFVFEYADGLGVDAVSISYEFAGAVVFRIPRLQLGTPKNGKREANAGSGDGDSGSVHTVRQNGRYVVVSDSGDDAKTGCSGFRITPPPPFDAEVDVLCADWVEVTPLSGTFPTPIGGVAVVGTGLGSFTATLLATE